jgi:hypothetical protein
MYVVRNLLFSLDYTSLDSSRFLFVRVDALWLTTCVSFVHKCAELAVTANIAVLYFSPVLLSNVI